MNYKIALLWIVIWCTSITYGQTISECNLIELVKVTLEKSPIIQQNALQIQNAQGQLHIQKSVFDYQLTAGFSLSRDKNHLFSADPRNNGIDNTIIETKNADFSLGLLRRFRTGLLAAVSIDYDHFSDNLRLNQFNQQVNPFISNNVVSSNFSLTQPLLRGRGNKVVTALEKTSALALESNEYNYEFTTSLELLQLVSKYWQYVTAYKNLTILQENEKRVRDVLYITNELVKADKKPISDLAQIKADLANQERQTTIALQSLFSSKLDLGRTIGLNDAESELIGIPKNDFPTIEESGFTTKLESKQMIQIASNNRKDLIAFEKNKESSELQLGLATNNLKPQLDLTGFASYGGMNMGNGFNQVLNTFSNYEGRNYNIGMKLNFSFPLNNNVAKGNYIISKAALQNQELANTNLRRNIDLNVNIAVNNVRNNVRILKKATVALKHSQEAFDNEQLKFRNGLTTLLNLLLFQERLTFSQRSYLQAQQNFAIAIVNLRFETGTLITMTNRMVSSVMDTSIFYSIPK